MWISPGDAFADCWKDIKYRFDELEQMGLVDPNFEQHLGRLELLARRFSFETAIGLTELSNWIGGDLVRTLAAAKAIDKWFDPVANSSTSELSKAQAEAFGLYIESARLNLDPDLGQVIFKRPLAGRYKPISAALPDQDELNRLFAILTVLPLQLESTDADDESIPSKVAVRFRMSRSADTRDLSRIEKWRVGFVPLAQGLDDISFELRVQHGDYWYDTKVGRFDDRLDEAVRRLCAEGCHVIVLSEMALHADSLEFLKRSVRRYALGSDVALVLAGSMRSVSPGGAMPSNECVVMDHGGREIFRQRKLSRWNLDKALCSRYHFQLEPGVNRLKEYIEPGTELTIVEQDGLGRLAALICEDLSRTQPGDWVRRNLLLELQFTPVLDGGFDNQRWTTRSGVDACLKGGCRVIVSNSVTLTSRQNVANVNMGAPERVVSSCGIGLLIERHLGMTKYTFATVPVDSTSTQATHIDWDPTNW
jgi:predicted amidohydrolase